MERLNQSEKKVLTLLEENARLPASQIAKRVRLSSEGVLKIIKRLENSRIITKFNTKFHYSRIGYRIYPVHIKLSKLNKRIKATLKQSILKHKSCAWFMFCEGEYDLLLSFKVLSQQDYSDMKRLLSELSDTILEKDVSVALYAFEISKSFIDEDKPRKLFPTYDYSLSTIDLGPKEMNILNMLKSNSRENILKIAQDVELSARVVSLKIKKLEKNKILSGFKTKINMSLLGYQPTIALVTFGTYSEDELRRFISYCQYRKGIHYLVQQIGKYDIELTLDVQNTKEFYNLIDDIRENFTFIKKITTLISKDNF